MSVVVINHLHFRGPVADYLATVQAEFPPVMRQCAGFEGFRLVQTDTDRATVLITWATPQDAQAGAMVVGPSLFAKHVAPNLASEQDRRVGPVVLEF